MAPRDASTPLHVDFWYGCMKATCAKWSSFSSCIRPFVHLARDHCNAKVMVRVSVPYHLTVLFGILEHPILDLNRILHQRVSVFWKRHVDAWAVWRYVTIRHREKSTLSYH